MAKNQQERKGLSVLQTCQRLGVMPNQVYMLVWTERLKAEKRNRRWWIDSESVEARLAVMKGRNEAAYETSGALRPNG